MPTTVEVTLYFFDELSEKAQDKAIERLYDINVHYDWWDFTYEDAARIGLEITEFDTYRCTIDGKLTESLPDVCRLIRQQHGKGCATFGTARQYLAEYVAAFKRDSWRSDFDECDHWNRAEWFREFRYSDAADEIANDFRKALLEDCLSILRREYDYLTDREAIVETIRANEYLFTESGRLY